MPMYIQFVKYTPEGARGLLDTGMVARHETMTAAVSKTGGTLHGFWAVDGGHWHVAALAEFPDNSAAEGLMRAYASGTWADHEAVRIMSPADFDAAAPFDYPAPGSI